MKTMICFDISDDRRRYRVARRLLDVATRVQKSVFEAPLLERAAYLRLRSDLEGIYDWETDSLRYYRVCGACAQRIEHVGTGVGLIEPPPPFEFIDD